MSKVMQHAESSFADVLLDYGNDTGYTDEALKAAYLEGFQVIHRDLERPTPEDNVDAVHVMQTMEKSLCILLTDGKDSYVKFCRGEINGVTDNVARTGLLRSAMGAMASHLGIKMGFQGGHSRRGDGISPGGR